MIEVSHLAKSFIGKRGRTKTVVKAVTDVSFTAHDGRITALNSFLDVGHLFPRFGLPLVLDAQPLGNASEIAER